MQQANAGKRLSKKETPVKANQPGRLTLEVVAQLDRFEAPGINTLGFGTPVVWQEAAGSTVTDIEGRDYIDLTSGFGVAAVGHRHPRVVEAIRRQSTKLIHGLGDVHPHPLRAELARRIADLVPVDDPRVYFAISGADAVEIALKTAILASERTGILAFDPCYHGCTLGALAVTSRKEFRTPFAGHIHPHVQRLYFGCDLSQVERVLSGGGFAAVILEPVVGREGTIFPPRGWLKAIARCCRDHDATLIVDEIFTGFGRLGAWFACEREDVRPDILCCGKALGGGLPIAAAVGRRELMEHWRVSGECLHTATFVAHPLACAAALATLDVIRDEDLIARAKIVGKGIGAELASWLDQLGEASGRVRDRVVEVRGRGMLWAIQVDSDRLALGWGRLAQERGLLTLAAGGIMRIEPPLSIPEEQLKEALQVLQRTFPEAIECD